MIREIYFPEADILDKMYAVRKQIYQSIERADLKRAERLFKVMWSERNKLREGSPAAKAALDMINDTWRYYLQMLYPERY